MNLTVEEAYKSYESYFKIRLKKRSIESKKSLFNLYIIPFFRSKKISDISKNDIVKFQEFLDKKNFTLIYKKTIYTAFVIFLNYCVNFLDLDKNIASQVGFILHDENLENKINIWSYKDFKKFIKKVDHKVYKYFYDFLYFTGCRQGEVLALTFNDVKNGIVSIKRTKIKGYNGFNSPKTKKSIRKFKIDFKLRIEIYLLKRYYIKNFEDFNNNFFIFGGRQSISPTTIARIKNKACKDAHVKQIRIHDFRHSHISLLISCGVPIPAVCERVGHKDVKTTLNIYAHVLERDNIKLISTLNLMRLRFF